MKKILLFGSLLFTLSILINCSPKTAKKAASSENGVTTRVSETAVNTNLVNEPNLEKDADIVSERDADAILNSIDDNQQVEMFKDMSPLRAEIGAKIYTMNCNKCHDYHKPESRTASSWVNVMKKMAKKADLSTDQHLMVNAYLVQNAKQ